MPYLITTFFPSEVLPHFAIGGQLVRLFGSFPLDQELFSFIIKVPKPYVMFDSKIFNKHQWKEGRKEGRNKGEGGNGGRTGRRRREGLGSWLKEKPLEPGSKILSLPLWSEIVLRVFVSWDFWPWKNSKWVLSFIILAGQTGIQKLGIRWRQNSFTIDRISLVSCVWGQAVCPWDVLTLCQPCGQPALAALPCCCCCLEACYC